MEPARLGDEAAEAGLLLIGIDRPGYGMSTPCPGRTIAGWVPDALAVADELGTTKLVAVGESTGGAYALALAALVPDRVLGVVACCAMTDMRWEGARCTMSRPHCHAVWDAPDDRLADGGGRVTFDVTTITCPVTVLHGEMDNMCNVVNARHTAEIVPNARLVLYDDLGHFSIVTNLIPTISDLLTR